MNSDRSIGSKLKAARLRAGLTQEEAATLSNCDRSTVAKKETGDRPIYASELAQFADIYNQPIAYFVESNDATGLFE